MMNDLNAMRDMLATTVIGSEEQAELLLIAAIANGHVLIEGPPGVGKTSLAEALAQGFQGDFRRIQFTPDLLPSDITGYNLFRPDQQRFEFIKGPVFSNFLLADEINRTSPRVQSALLESMNEGTVTIDGVTHQLQKPFMVIATQNSGQSVGTFPLPEPQLDRFLFSIELSLPQRAQQIAILEQANDTQNHGAKFTGDLNLQTIQEQLNTISAHQTVLNYAVDLCENLRRAAGGHDTLSVRASLALLKAARAAALVSGARAVHPDHLQAIFAPTMRHRIFTLLDIDRNDLVAQIIEETPVP